jgi:hypothetical protein
MNSMLVQEIKALYEEGGLKAEEIGRELGLETAAVGMCLKTVSRQYVSELLQEGSKGLVDSSGNKVKSRKEQISDEEDDLIVNALKELGFSGEDERVRFQALVYLHNEKLGRNDKQDGRENEMKINVITLNGAIREAQRAIGIGYDDIIDIESVGT